MATFQTSYVDPTTGQTITVSADSPDELSEAMAKAKGTDRQDSDLEAAFASGGDEGMIAYLEAQGIPTTHQAD